MRILVVLTLFIVASVLLSRVWREDTLIAQDVPSSISASNPEKASNNDGLVKKTENRQLVREGTTVQSKHVIFRIAGNRAIMTTVQDSERFFCLENLNLQRVTDVLRANPTFTDWTVDYVVTEYKGENFALIQRAVLTSSALRPASR
ncbi:MAG: hypothetical protein FWD31_11055 [Planctomycetaceae bacterium]|nr:hypothetical protein [Planctomycetaceae bacterium]